MGFQSQAHQDIHATQMIFGIQDSLEGECAVTVCSGDCQTMLVQLGTHTHTPLMPTALLQRVQKEKTNFVAECIHFIAWSLHFASLLQAFPLSFSLSVSFLLIQFCWSSRSWPRAVVDVEAAASSLTRIFTCSIPIRLCRAVFFSLSLSR